MSERFFQPIEGIVVISNPAPIAEPAEDNLKLDTATPETTMVKEAVTDDAANE